MHIVFIGGPQRAGTTLVQTLIANALGNSVVLPEAHAVHGLIEIYKRGMSDWPKNKHFFGDQSSFCNFIRSCVEQILDSVILINGPTEFMVLKDPNFAMVQERILELFPQATSFFCARDPRDIVCSFIKIERREAKLSKRSKHYSGRNIAFYCSKIKKSCQQALNPSFPAILVKYEDIVTNPRGELENLAAVSGLPFSFPDLDNMRWTEAGIRHKHTWISALEERRPSTESIGGFQKILSTKEIAYIEKSCSSILAKFHYVPLITERRRTLPFRILGTLRNHIWSETQKPG